MKKFLKIAITAVSLLLFVLVGTTFWIFRPHVPEGAEIFPTKIIMEKESPDKKVKAQILEGQRIEGFNPLGSNERYYLTLQYPNVRNLIVRDLSEGSGSYEGGVLGLKWLDSNRVYIDRVVSDQRNDLIYNLSKNECQDPEIQ
jgi:hypothetical protein